MPKLDASNNDAHLSIFKASAGSGKTHRLTSEYLNLLYVSPYAYRHILAVTFTNKATDEMKSRIIDELANLAANKKSDYVDILSKKHKLDEAGVRARAKEILVRILHDYSSFSVSTIDKFFQQTMRAFTREIGLGGGYNVELDTDSVLGEAIDSMLSDLERKENEQLLEWLIRFSEEKVENGETWNIRNDIHALAREIFKESYKAYSEYVRKDIEDKPLINEYKELLHSIVSAFEEESQRLGEKGANIIHTAGLSPDDFKGSSRSPFYNFAKWGNKEIIEPNATFLKMADDISTWYTAKTDGSIKSQIEGVYNDLNKCINEIISHYQHIHAYNTASQINRYFFTLGILGDIDKKIRDFTSENNMMLISDTTELLSKIIEGNESPFIYEKIGTRINNYMIDEFQDTSGMQWNNFLPLVRDSLATANQNYIVGDVKQSIYRWRNSDWKLLDEQLDIDFRNEGLNHETLDTNWRSDANIIGFNNAIFTQGAQILQDTYNQVLEEDSQNQYLERFNHRITKAYDGVYQHTPERKKDSGGYVKIEFINTKEHNWQDYAIEQLPHQVEQLQDGGYSLKDIAILVRTKKEGALVANRLLEYKSQNPNSKYKYDIISDEALYVDSSQSIKLVVALLRYMQNSLDKSLKALAIYEYLKYSGQLKAEDALQKYFSDDEQLPETILVALASIRELPLYEMTEEIFGLFDQAIDDNEQIYIQSFLDMILDYSVKNSSDVDSFLTWWEETGKRKTIYTPDGQDAIRIMTIHKSKGLGFNIVILPFCHWEIDHRLPTILWCHPQVEPFNKLHLVPVKYSKKLIKSIFNYEYYDEKLHAYIDNLNVLYVAFTRAKNGLIAFSPKPEKDEVKNISSLLWACTNLGATNQSAEKSVIDLSAHLDTENAIFEMGELRTDKKLDEDHSHEIEIANLPSIPYSDRLKLLLNNKQFFTESGQRDYGTLMHEVVSRIQTIDDIEDAVMKYHLAGSITIEQMEDVVAQLRIYLQNPIVHEWYSGGYTVLNEVAILQPSGRFIRPDRVMIKDSKATVIDYKFGETEQSKYIKQVQRYAEQIEQMGYKNVDGYVCYIRLGKVIKV